MVSAGAIRGRAMALGADLVGFAPVTRFADAPPGFHPTDVLPGCRTVIVVAERFPASTLAGGSQAAYTNVRNQLVARLDSVTFDLSVVLEGAGAAAIPIPSSDPYDYWDEERRHGRGILSLKHAAVRAGLGQMGKNTLLINDVLGNMLWLGGIVTDAELEADPVAGYQACLPTCTICLDRCPVGALDGITVDQRKCRSLASKCTEGGGVVYACNLCRKVCPRHLGIG